MTPTILTFGEALIDFKQQDGLDFKGYEGGSPMNVAIAASRLGSAVGFGGQVSSDLFGESLRSYLEENRVDTSFLLESERPSTLAFVAEIDGDAHFSFMGEGAADRHYDPQPRPSLPASVTHIMFGSISLLYEPTSSSITDIIAAHQDSAVVVLDPNVRPALTPDKDDYVRKLHGWVALADIVKVSAQDLEWLYGERNPKATAEDWLGRGPSAVLITDGGEGVTLYRSKQPPLKVKAPKVEVVDTVGAGDTFTGTLLSELSQRDELAALSDEAWSEVLNLAAHGAALNCTRDGADPPTRAELDAFMKEA